MVEDVRSELRDQITGIVQDYDPSAPGLGDSALEIADRILAIPRIAEALSQTPGVSGSVER